MLKFWLLIALLILPISSDAEASDTSSGDLMAAYPQARNELVALLTCRAYYVGQHYQEKVPAEVIAARSSVACIKEREQFIKKIGNPLGGPQFLVPPRSNFCDKSKQNTRKRPSIRARPRLEQMPPQACCSSRVSSGCGRRYECRICCL